MAGRARRVRSSRQSIYGYEQGAAARLLRCGKPSPAASARSGTGACLRRQARVDGPERDPKEIFLRIKRESSWGPSDTDFLASMSDHHYIHFFRSLEGDDLRTVIHSGLRFTRMIGGDPSCEAIGRKTIAALQALGAESTLNAMRVHMSPPRMPSRTKMRSVSNAWQFRRQASGLSTARHGALPTGHWPTSGSNARRS